MVDVDELLEALAAVRDPCLSLAGHDLSILDLGLITSLSIDDGHVHIAVTFTEPGCVFGHRILAGLRERAASVGGVTTVDVVPQPFPAWTEARLSPKARRLFRRSSARIAAASLAAIPVLEERP